MSATIIAFPARKPRQVELLPDGHGAFLVRARGHEWTYDNLTEARGFAAWLAANDAAVVVVRGDAQQHGGGR